MEKMTKQQTIQYLTDLMATIQGAYFKGRMEGHTLWVHERMDDSAAISIDLYNFEGDGEPVCEGLKPCTVTYDDGSQDTGWLFCMCYDPDDVTPLTFLFSPDDIGVDPMDIDPEDLSEGVLQAVTAWLEQAMQPVQPKEYAPKKRTNDVTSFMYYMWNAWCKKECEIAFAGYDWNHFWTKWCGLAAKYPRFGAVDEFYAELSDHYRDMLVKRATQVFEGNRQIQN